LRYRVADFSCRSSHRQILRAAQHFDVKVIPLTEVYWEFENLYWDYLSGVQFRTAQSLYDLLGIEYGQSGIFDAYFMVVSDKGEDIAIGIFYRGENSIAAISNFYNPKYNKYSLGKLLMLKIIQEAQRWGIQYYYPGYVTRGWSKFDYKLFLGEAHAETLDRSADKWVPFHAECLAPKSYSNSDVEDIVAAITNPTHTIL
jgi:arginyl-tRNA--protein-N-Asp/Glu arginylyltransferase